MAFYQTITLKTRRTEFFLNGIQFFARGFRNIFR